MPAQEGPDEAVGGEAGPGPLFAEGAGDPGRLGEGGVHGENLVGHRVRISGIVPLLLDPAVVGAPALVGVTVGTGLDGLADVVHDGRTALQDAPHAAMRGRHSREGRGAVHPVRRLGGRPWGYCAPEDLHNN